MAQNLMILDKFVDFGQKSKIQLFYTTWIDTPLKIITKPIEGFSEPNQPSQWTKDHKKPIIFVMGTH